MKTLSPGLYAVACVVVPVAWGILVVWVMDRVEQVLRRRGSSIPPPPEYYI